MCVYFFAAAQSLFVNIFYKNNFKFTGLMPLKRAVIVGVWAYRSTSLKKNKKYPHNYCTLICAYLCIHIYLLNKS